jgi:hypothetical protein
MRTTLKMAAALLLAASGHAQEVAAYVGFGGAHAPSTGEQIETYGDGNLYKTSNLDGFFVRPGFSVFLTKHFGVGAEIAWRGPKGDYAGIPFRSIFYNVDAIYRPSKLSTKRLLPELRGGLGGARTRFTPNDDLSCAQVDACPAANHFQQHFGAAVRWYWTTQVFIRPAFDLNHVNHFDEFGSNWVPQYSLGLGYSIGRRE